MRSISTQAESDRQLAISKDSYTVNFFVEVDLASGKTYFSFTSFYPDYSQGKQSNPLLEDVVSCQNGMNIDVGAKPISTSSVLRLYNDPTSDEGIEAILGEEVDLVGRDVRVFLAFEPAAGPLTLVEADWIEITRYKIESVQTTTGSHVNIRLTDYRRSEGKKLAVDLIDSTMAPDAPAKTLGAALQEVVGRAKDVPCLLWTKTISVELDGSINENTLTIYFADYEDLLEDFEIGDVLKVDQEELLISEIERIGNAGSAIFHIDPDGRGYNSTEAVYHSDKSTAYKIPSTIEWLVSRGYSSLVGGVVPDGTGRGKISNKVIDVEIEERLLPSGEEATFAVINALPVIEELSKSSVKENLDEENELVSWDGLRKGTCSSYFPDVGKTVITGNTNSSAVITNLSIDAEKYLTTEMIVEGLDIPNSAQIESIDSPSQVTLNFSASSSNPDIDLSIFAVVFPNSSHAAVDEDDSRGTSYGLIDCDEAVEGMPITCIADLPTDLSGRLDKLISMWLVIDWSLIPGPLVNGDITWGGPSIDVLSSGTSIFGGPKLLKRPGIHEILGRLDDLDLTSKIFPEGDEDGTSKELFTETDIGSFREAPLYYDSGFLEEFYESFEGFVKLWIWKEQREKGKFTSTLMATHDAKVLAPFTGEYFDTVWRNMTHSANPGSGNDIIPNLYLIGVPPPGEDWSAEVDPIIAVVFAGKTHKFGSDDDPGNPSVPFRITLTLGDHTETQTKYLSSSWTSFQYIFDLNSVGDEYKTVEDVSKIRLRIRVPLVGDASHSVRNNVKFREAQIKYKKTHNYEGQKRKLLSKTDPVVHKQLLHALRFTQRISLRDYIKANHGDTWGLIDGNLQVVVYGDVATAPNMLAIRSMYIESEHRPVIQRTPRSDEFSLLIDVDGRKLLPIRIGSGSVFSRKPEDVLYYILSVKWNLPDARINLSASEPGGLLKACENRQSWSIDFVLNDPTATKEELLANAAAASGVFVVWDGGRFNFISSLIPDSGSEVDTIGDDLIFGDLVKASTNISLFRNRVTLSYRKDLATGEYNKSAGPFQDTVSQSDTSGVHSENFKFPFIRDASTANELGRWVLDNTRAKFTQFTNIKLDVPEMCLPTIGDGIILDYPDRRVESALSMLAGYSLVCSKQGGIEFVPKFILTDTAFRIWEDPFVAGTYIELIPSGRFDFFIKGNRVAFLESNSKWSFKGNYILYAFLGVETQSDMIEYNGVSSRLEFGTEAGPSRSVVCAIDDDGNVYSGSLGLGVDPFSDPQSKYIDDYPGPTENSIRFSVDKSNITGSMNMFNIGSPTFNPITSAISGKSFRWNIPM